MTRLEQMLQGSPYVSYLYGYPHKTAYRALTPAVPLEQAWANERRESLFLYLHVPFCEMRCGFCNLFTAAGPTAQVMTHFVDALEREAKQAKAAIGDASFARVAIGGGTPTILEVPELARVLDVAEGVFGARLSEVPFCVEVSPETATDERLDLLAARGVDRVSIGVQSFIEAETQALKRPQKLAEVTSALERIRARNIDTLNVDLIYGIEGQTTQSFEHSLRAALQFAPEEIYLYPLYVRPLTFLGKAARAWDDFRLSLYRHGRALLLGEGYRQVSMRMFRRVSAGELQGPPYRCQEDGMVGVGVGARSYTSGLHYSSDWAVSPRAVRGIIDGYCERDDASFASAHHGIALDAHEQRRRFVILSLLADGVSFADYRARFGALVSDDFPQLAELSQHGLATFDGATVSLTPEGVERSDLLGPWLHSAQVDGLMQEYQTR